MPVTQKPSKARLRRWLIALAIAAFLFGLLWVLWSANASVSNNSGPASHPTSHGAGHAPFVPVRGKHSAHAPSLHETVNAGGLRHLTDLNKIWDVDGGEGVGFSPPDRLPFLNTLPADDDSFSFPAGGNWHGFSNQGMGPGISGPGGTPTGNSQGDKPSAEDSSRAPGTRDSSEPGPGNFPNNSDLTSAVPEPATWATMLIGFGAIGCAMRRRKKLQSRSEDQYQY
jgi:hypothetical protein